MELHLEKITYLNWHDVENLHVTREQKEFLPDNVTSLAYAGIVRESGFHVFTFGIYKGKKPIGFVMIGYDIPYEPDDDLNEKYRLHDRQAISGQGLWQRSHETHP